MAKKESPKPQASPKPPFKLAAFLHRLLSVKKLILGLCLIFFSYSVSYAFLKELGKVGSVAESYFWVGVFTFLIIDLFIWEPLSVYTKGQKILTAVFSFFAPLVKVASYLLPIYTILLFVFYWAAFYLFGARGMINLFMFLFSFTLSLHLVFSARTLRAKQEDFLKANYIFGFSFIYVTNVALLAFFLNTMFRKFSFVDFSNRTFLVGKYIIFAIIKQLFLR